MRLLMLHYSVPHTTQPSSWKNRWQSTAVGLRPDSPSLDVAADGTAVGCMLIEGVGVGRILDAPVRLAAGTDVGAVRMVPVSFATHPRDG